MRAPEVHGASRYSDSARSDSGRGLRACRDSRRSSARRSPAGSVAAVGLEPNAETVTVCGEERKVFTATAALIERALLVRNIEVIASGVEVDGKLRLLRLDDANEEFGTFEERAEFVMDRWAETLEALSK